MTRCTCGAVNSADIWNIRKGAGAFFAEYRKSVRNSDVEVSRTPDLKFWMFLGGEESEIDHVRCVRKRSVSAKLWGDTFTDTVPEPDLNAERVARNVKWSSRKSELSRANRRRTARRSLATAGGPQFLRGGVGVEESTLLVPS